MSEKKDPTPEPEVEQERVSTAALGESPRGPEESATVRAERQAAASER